MTEKQIKAKINQLRSLKSYRGKTDDELRKKAIKSLQEKERKESYQFSGLGYPDKTTKKHAEKHFESLRSKYNIDSISDLQLLEERIFLSFLCEQYKIASAEKQKKALKSDKISFFDAIDLKEDEWYQKTIDKIASIDDRLGIGKSQEKEGFDAYREFYERCIAEAQENIADHVTKCVHCGEWNHHIYEVKDYDTFPYAMLRGTWLYNEPLMELIDEGKLTMEDVRKIWHQPKIDYVKMCYEEIYLKDKTAKERERKI